VILGIMIPGFSKIPTIKIATSDMIEEIIFIIYRQLNINGKEN
jgi:hypothetical protein